MKKILTVGFLLFFGGAFLSFLIVYLVLIPAGIFPSGHPLLPQGVTPFRETFAYTIPALYAGGLVKRSSRIYCEPYR